MQSPVSSLWPILNRFVKKDRYATRQSSSVQFMRYRFLALATSLAS